MEPALDLFVYAAGGTVLAAALRWWRPRLQWRHLLLYLLLSLAFFGPALLTDRHQIATDIAYMHLPWRELEPIPGSANPLLVDPLFQILPERRLVRQRWLHGAAPLWAHELGLGQPLAGNAHSAAFSPIHFLALPLPALRALTVVAAWSVALAMMMMHALLVEHRVRASVAAFGAVAFAFSTYCVVWVYHPHTLVVAWLPGIFLSLFLMRTGTEVEAGASARSRRLRGVLGLAVCGAGAATSGHPGVLACCALAAGVYLVWLLARPAPGSRGSFLAATTAAGVLALALAAPALATFLSAVPESYRYAITRGRPIGGEDDPRQVLLLASPLALGSPRDGNWSGPRNFNEVSASYPGALTLALALAGVLLSRRSALLVGAATITLATAFGFAPLIGLLQSLPLLEGNFPGRLRVIAVLLLAAAAAFSLQAILEAEGSRRRWLPIAAIAAVLAAQIAVPPAGGGWQRGWWLVSLATLIAGAVLLGRRPRPAAAAPLLAALLVGDLFTLGMRYHPSLPPRLRLEREPAALATMRRSAAEAPGFRAVGEDLHLFPFLGAYAGLDDPRSYDPMHPLRSFRFLRSQVPVRGSPINLNLRVRRPLQPMLDAVSVRWALTGHQRRLPAPWRSIFDGEGGRVWENPQALPLFFVPPTVAAWPREGPPRAGTHSYRDAALVFGDRAAPREQPAGRVEALQIDPNGYRLVVSTPAPALVASSVSHSTSWRITNGGEPVVPVVVNTAFLGFEAPAGRSEVRIRYRPASWWPSVALALAGLATCLGLALAIRRQNSP